MVVGRIGMTPGVQYFIFLQVAFGIKVELIEVTYACGSTND